MTETVHEFDLDEALKRLRLPRIRACWKEWADRAARGETGYEDFLRNLVSDELAAREETKLRRLLRQADFPFHKTVDEFDFRLQPQIRRQVFQSYLEDSFVREGRSLVMIGQPGLGKTHLGVAVGLRTVHRFSSVRFVVVQELMNRYLASETHKQRVRILKPYKKCDLLILDEFGYLPHGPELGPLLYEIISERYEHSATIITSNKSLKEWGKVLSDTALASALVDRLMHHGDVYYLKGKSYRLRDKPSTRETSRDG
jgi:DNA replication protein DnaC